MTKENEIKILDKILKYFDDVDEGNYPFADTQKIRDAPLDIREDLADELGMIEFEHKTHNEFQKIRDTYN